MFYDRLIFWRKRKKYPNLGKTMKTPEEIAAKLNAERELQMQALRQKRTDMELQHRIRYETLLWVLGKNADNTA